MSFDPSDCAPLSLTRGIADFPIGNIPLGEHHRRVVGETGVNVHPCAWIEPADLADFLASGKSALVDGSGLPLAWNGDEPDSDSTVTAKASFFIRYPWDFLRANELYVSALVSNSIHGEIHPSAVVEGTIHLGLGTRILPGVYIEGNVVIGANCKVGPNCYIRGQSVEIKNCLILSNTNVGHLSYIGDSVLGEKVNLGAGTTTSNLRHDGKNHRSTVGGDLIDTGRRKFGTIIGDHVHTGINTSIYPGRKLWPNTTTRPGDIVQRDVLSST